MKLHDFCDYARECDRIETALNYLPDFDNTAVFRAWEAGGLFSLDTSSEKPRWWLNVAAHMSVAAVVGFKITERLSAHVEKEGMTVRDIVEALLVHDWSKRLEAEAARMQGCSTVRPFDPDFDRRLKEYFSDTASRVPLLVEAAGGKGMKSACERVFSLGKKIIFISDYATSGGAIVSFQKRAAEFLPHLAAGGRYEGIERYYRQNYGVSHNEKLSSLYLSMEADIGKRIGWSGEPGTLALSLTPSKLHA